MDILVVYFNLERVVWENISNLGIDSGEILFDDKNGVEWDIDLKNIKRIVIEL